VQDAKAVYGTRTCTFLILTYLGFVHTIVGHWLLIGIYSNSCLMFTFANIVHLVYAF